MEFLEDEDLATALLAMAECDNDETPAEGLDELASAAQQLFVGYMAAGTHKGKSKGKGKPSGKGKNKGKEKGKHVCRTQLSVEDRVKRLKELKQRSKCLRCGGQGHTLPASSRRDLLQQPQARSLRTTPATWP